MKGDEVSRAKKNAQSEGAGTAAGKTDNNSNSKQEEKEMSKQDPTPETPTPKAPEKETVKKTFKFYDLQSFELKEKEDSFDFTPPATYEEAVNRLTSLMSGDQNSLRDALTPILRNAAIASQARNAIGENGARKKIVLDQIKGFRDAPPYNAMVTSERGKPGWKEQYAKQTEAILNEIKNVPFLVNVIKAKAAADTGAEGEEEE